MRTKRRARSARSSKSGPSRPRTMKPTRPATPRQAEILTYVRDYIHKNGYSPTYDEIAAQFGITKVTVFEHLATLASRGLVHHEKHKTRSLHLASHLELPDDRPSCLRLAGRIAAGSPIEAIEDREVVDLEQLFGATPGTFVLEVKGDSMIEDHIADGDYVVVEPRQTPENGETVVALLDNGEATLKRFYREKSRIRLQPANAKYPPIYTDSAKIQGVMVGVIRRTR